MKSKMRGLTGGLIALMTVALLLPGHMVIAAGTMLQDQTARIPTDQLDSLVAPIALYPDSLLSQVLVASTYPLEIVQLQQWLQRNAGLTKDQNKLADTVKNQPWDPSIQALAA